MTQYSSIKKIVKRLLIALSLTVLIVATQVDALESQKSLNYSTGEVKFVADLVDSKLVRATSYNKAGGVNLIIEFKDGEVLKTTYFAMTDEVINI
jgi:hypothetical protein